MSTAVTIVSAGGIPVTIATTGYGVPVTAVPAGGLAVTIRASGGLPVVGGIGGSDVGPNYSMLAFPGRFALTGESMTTIAGYTTTAGVGAFTLAGQNSALTPPTVAYTGPGEITGWDTAYGYWGLRAYNTSKIGANCIDVCANNIGAAVSLTTVVIGPDGYANLTPIGFSPIYVNRIYDQSGASGAQDLFFNNGAFERPTLTPSMVGGKPAMFFTGSTWGMSTSNATALPQAISVAAISRNNGVSNGQVLSDGTFGFSPLFSNTAAQMGQTFGVFTHNHAAAANNTFGAYISIASSNPLASGASSTMCFNGTITTVSGGVGPNGIGSTNRLSMGGNDSGGGGLLNGYIYEVMIKAGQVSPANQALLNTNMHGIGTGWV